MKKDLTIRTSLITLLLIIVGTVSMTAQTVSYTENISKKTVFDNPTTYNNMTTYYRIPAIATLSNGSLYAVCDMRIGGSGDIGTGVNIDVVAKKSTDNGKTWGSQSIIVKGESSSGYDYAHGDPAIVTDSETGKIILLCNGGVTGYGSGGCCLGVYTSSDNGATWTGGEVTDAVKNACTNAGVTFSNQFFTSGRAIQSSKVKVGSSYRIYSAMCTGSGSVVMYSDDLGSTWNVLGSKVAYSGGDETVLEELPNGDLLLSARLGGSGRGFNVFRYSNIKTGSGSWNSSTATALSAATNCNGEMLLLPTSKPNCYVLLHSVSLSGRTNVTVYYKIINTETDAYSTSSYYSSGWNTLKQMSTTTSCYSTMVKDKDGNVAFLFEENNSNGGYDIQYINFTPTVTFDPSTDDFDGKTVTLTCNGYKSSSSSTFTEYLYNDGGTLTPSSTKPASDTQRQFVMTRTDNGGYTFQSVSDKSLYLGINSNDNMCLSASAQEFNLVKNGNYSSGSSSADMNGYALQYERVNTSTAGDRILVAVSNQPTIDRLTYSSKNFSSSSYYFSTDFTIEAVEAAGAYTITCNNDGNGTVSSNRSSADEGQTITLTVSPSSGYTLTGLTVKDAEGNIIGKTKNASGNYTFTMPGSNVTADATFDIQKFVRKTSGTIDTSKKYLIVYESSSTSGILMNSNFTTNVGITNVQCAAVGETVAISSNAITTASTNAFTFEPSGTDGTYYLKNNAGYYCGNSSTYKWFGVSNSQTAFTNTVSFSGEAVQIVGNYSSWSLGYTTTGGGTSGNCGFHYGSGIYSICLYEEMPIRTYDIAACGTNITLSGSAITDTDVQNALTYLNAHGTKTDNSLVFVEDESYTNPNALWNVVVKGSDGNYTCAKFALTDATASNNYAGFATATDFTAASATYSRQIGSGLNWATVCLPYDVASVDGIEFYDITGISNGTLVIAKRTTSPVLPAGTPALAKAATAGSAFTAKGSGVKVSNSTVTVGTDVKMIGTFNEEKIETGNSFYIKDDKFYQRNNYFWADPFRAYFTTSSATAKEISIPNQETDAIRALTGESDTDVEGIYNAGGMRLSNLQDGLNIIRLSNGKTQKIMVK